MNTCPVYRRSGGLSYGATYSGPIGVIIDPTFNLRKYSSLPFASTLNGSCTSVCPVKINIHEQIYKWRQVIAERHQLPMVKKETMRMAGKVLASPKLYRAAVEAAGRGHRASAALPRLQPVQRLGSSTRDAGFPRQTSRSWYLKNGSCSVSSREHDPCGGSRNQPARRPTFPMCRCSSARWIACCGLPRRTSALGGTFAEARRAGPRQCMRRCFPKRR